MVCWTLIAGLLCAQASADAAIAAGELPSHVRRPVALVPAGDVVLVANQHSGTLSVLDVRAGQVVSEHPVAGRISHLVPHPGRADAWVLDEAGHRLLAVTRGGGGLQVVQVADLPAYPVRAAVWPEGRRVLVSSLWSRRLTVLRMDESWERTLGRSELALDFPPRELLWLPDERRLLVADAFGGRLAVVDVAAERVERVRQLDAHNLRGLALSGDGRTLYLTHQSLDSSAWTDRDDVHWGILMTNALHGVPVESLLRGEGDPLRDAWIERLGQVGRAAGDPGPVWLDHQGRLAVALSGVGEVSVTGGSYAQSVAVGSRPVALCVVGDLLLAANHLDDSVSVIDLGEGQVVRTISLGPAPELTASQRGERLFFDARLSHDRWMSCHSCHSEGHTIERLSDTLGDGGYGAPKRILSLLGTGRAGPWAWNGSSESLEDQIQKSVRSTMHGAELSADQVRDLVAYLHTLEPPPPPRPVKSAEVELGRQVFQREGCQQCHRPPTYTSAGVYDVRLTDRLGARRFNPPSLLGVGQRDLLLHDGLATSLEQVILELRHPAGRSLDPDDARALLEFLRSL
ncbi:MAG: hypothetical protein J5I93_19855 [Pirellulaceae bacterium]|nr:hypothetical protein [Pirellulaceae bacterium]